MNQQESEILKESSKEVNEYLERAIPVLEGLLVPLREGRSVEPISSLASAADGLGGLVQYASSARTLLESYNADLADAFYNFESRLGAALEPLVAGMDAQDAVLVADIVEYELIPALKELQSAVRDVLGQSNIH
ncbi:hypothetical protein [Ectothiorhodospira variabilis]|uniref:hypothetical protein n=1 Tax=Ectothiorhodospira variabilis TaxID=505694 RepID=UPI001EFA3F28|nr:hypothetical protein [Ectothiorhodospira variabilis]MCG5494657.1 hypothetical protein [Ectothiorhodospira variabilis]MCG5499061.1 hypothetical protein [Ectothiorhodospira variabilis]MCG5505121.1 hypothetical protein [Ectothiorhodospira variabilis]MCG5508278.1 hypothetical protein [Ectothiorhodospira variabilis]